MEHFFFNLLIFNTLILFFENYALYLFFLNISMFLVVVLVNELVWPTHLFNKKHNYSTGLKHYRTYNEYMVKFFNKNLGLRIFYSKLYNIFYL